MTDDEREKTKAWVEHWKRVGPLLERIRREELRNWEYDPDLVDAVLELGCRLRVERKTSGLVEQQRWFMKARRAAEGQG